MAGVAPQPLPSHRPSHRTPLTITIFVATVLRLPAPQIPLWYYTVRLSSRNRVLLPRSHFQLGGRELNSGINTPEVSLEVRIERDDDLGSQGVLRSTPRQSRVARAPPTETKSKHRPPSGRREGKQRDRKKKEREESTSESRTQFMAEPHNIYATAVSERLTLGRVGTRVRVRGLEAPVPRMRPTWCSKHHV